MSTPYKCPVCSGTGRVRGDSYVTMFLPTTDECRACNGTGVVWESAAQAWSSRQSCSKCGCKPDVLSNGLCPECWAKHGSITLSVSVNAKEAEE